MKALIGIVLMFYGFFADVTMGELMRCDGSGARVSQITAHPNFYEIQRKNSTQVYLGVWVSQYTGFLPQTLGRLHPKTIVLLDEAAAIVFQEGAPLPARLLLGLSERPFFYNGTDSQTLLNCAPPKLPTVELEKTKSFVTTLYLRRFQVALNEANHWKQTMLLNARELEPQVYQLNEVSADWKRYWERFDHEFRSRLIALGQIARSESFSEIARRDPESLKAWEILKEFAKKTRRILPLERGVYPLIPTEMLSQF